MRSFWCVFLVFLVASQSVDAKDKGPNDPNEKLLAKWDAVIEDPNNPKELLQAKWNAIVKVLHAKDLDQKVKEDVIEKIVSPIFDFPLMGKLTLGKTHWPKLTPPQRKKFIRLFAERLKTSYRKKISLYKDEQASFKPVVRKKRTIHIPMVLISPNKNITILYKLHNANKCWKIYDVEIQGVSIILTYRSQFNDILSRSTVKDLIFQLEKPPIP
jgi:phospholipid transport system substrate-binding protein